MPFKIGEIATGLTNLFRLPLNEGKKTATVNGSPASIASEVPGSVTLASIPAYGSDVVIGVEDLNLDFTRGVLDPRITFTRSTTATFTGSNGLIQTAAINAPRFDYNPTTRAPLGLLIEEQRTNLVTYSSDYTNAVWTKTDTTVTASSSIAPDGTNTGTLLTQGSAGLAEVYAAISITAGTTITYSRYVKAGNSRWYRLQVKNGGLTSFAYAWFDLTNGVVGGTSVIGGVATISGNTITSVGNGWFRLTFTVMIGAAFTTAVFAGSSVTNNNEATTISGGTRLEWGNQIEAGAFATSYIPTVASQVTRSADVATMTGTNFSSWHNASEGTMYVEGASASTSRTIIAVDDGSMSNRYQLTLAGSYTPGFAVVSGGVVSADIYTTALTQGTFAREAGAYKVNDFALSTNGSSVAADTSGVLPVSANTLRFGAFQNGSNILCGTIKRIVYYPRRLSNAELQSLTAAKPIVTTQDN